jgi:biopolymer transport protein ExbB
MKEMNALFAAGGPAMIPIALSSLLAWWLVFDATLRLRSEQQDLALSPALRSSAPLLLSFQRRWSSRLRLISSLGAALPLLGLLGTVFGMIATFDSLDGQPGSAAGLAKGVSAALITTQAGLLLSLPIVLAERVLHARSRAIYQSLERARSQGAA